MGFVWLFLPICLLCPAIVNGRVNSVEDSDEDTSIDTSRHAYKDPSSFGPFTNHFKMWLASSDRDNTTKEVLAVFDKYGDSGTFGGRAFEGQKIRKEPVIFIHGNADSALDFGNPTASGWSAVLKDYEQAGYTTAELYGITYGERNISLAMTTTLTCDILQTHRKFLEHVLEYTGASKVDIVGHSMGATIARKIVKGGIAELKGEMCDLGENMADRVDSLVLLAGAHYGMCICGQFTELNACHTISGFYASQSCGNGQKHSCSSVGPGICENPNYGEFLKSLNNDPAKEGQFIFSLWSDDDVILGQGNTVWGRKTSLAPNTHRSKSYGAMDHFQIKKGSAEDQISLIQKHHFPGQSDRRRIQRSERTDPHLHHKKHHHHHKTRSSAEIPLLFSF